MAQQSGPGADSHNQVALQDQNFMPSENPAGNVADKIVEMAKKQRADRKSKKSG
jgi:hypothetical protein